MLLRKTLSLLIVVVLGSSATKQNRTYDGDKLFKIKINKHTEWSLCVNLLGKTIPAENIDVFREPSSSDTAGYIHINAEDVQRVSALLDDYEFDFQITIEDIGKLISQGAEANAIRNKDDVVGRYARYDEIVDWMQDIEDEFPEIASLLSIGEETYEGRTMRSLKLGVDGPERKWRIWVDGGVHAREWISPASVIYIIDKIIQGYRAGDETINKWLEVFDWYIMPVANVDGYEYCHTNERLWRKNRRPNEDSTCVGTDLNRNFDFQWGGVSADPNPCSNLFMGPYADSEIETQNMINFIMDEQDEWLAYISYHAWGQQFFTRWDYTANEVPEDHEELLDLARRSVSVMNATHGEFWEYGTAPDLMYAFAGGSADWARGVADIKYAYLLELRDRGEYAFVLPPEQIIPQGEEVWAGLQVLVTEFIEKWENIPVPNTK